MSATSQPAHSPWSRRRRLIAIGFAVLILGTVFHYRLALTPDRLVARSIQHHLRNVVGLAEVQRVLSREYTDITVGEGDGRWWDPNLPSIPGACNIQLLVGEYRVLFVTSVEALVVLDQAGQVHSVLVRRTTLGI